MSVTPDIIHMTDVIPKQKCAVEFECNVGLQLFQYCCLMDFETGSYTSMVERF